MKIKKTLFVGALVLALGFGAIATPLVGNAQANDPAVQNGNGQKLGQYFAGSMRDTVSSTLGITVDELYSLRSAGNSIVDIAEEQGVAIDDLQSAALDAKTDQIEQLYNDGKITEDQKDYMLSQLGDNMLDNMNRTEIGNQGKTNENAKRFNQDADFERGQGRGNGAGFANSNNQ